LRCWEFGCHPGKLVPVYRGAPSKARKLKYDEAYPAESSERFGGTSNLEIAFG